jgi:hypothetical protein
MDTDPLCITMWDGWADGWLRTGDFPQPPAEGKRAVASQPNSASSNEPYIHGAQPACINFESNLPIYLCTRKKFPSIGVKYRSGGKLTRMRDPENNV